MYACQFALALASDIPAPSNARQEPFSKALNKMIFNLSPLSLGLEKENQGAAMPNFSITFLIIVSRVHYYYYHPPFSAAPPPHFRLAQAAVAVAQHEEKVKSGRRESFLQGQSTSGN